MHADVSNEKVEGKKLVVENFNNFYEKSGSKRQKYMKYEIYPQLTNETYKGWMYGMYKVYTDYKKTTITESEFLENTKIEGVMVYLPHVLVNQEQVICTILSEGFHNDVAFFITKSAKESLKRQARYLYDHISFYKLCNCQTARRMTLKEEVTYPDNQLYIAVSERTDEMPEYKQEEKTEDKKMLNDNYSQLEKFITEEMPSIDIMAKEEEMPSIEFTAKEEEMPSIDIMTKEEEMPSIDIMTKEEEMPSIDVMAKEEEMPNKAEEPEQKTEQKRYFITSRRHQKPGDAHIPAPIVMLGCYARILVLEDNGSYSLHIRHADSSYEGQAVILDEEGANKDILTHKDFIFMIDNDFPSELEAIKQIEEKEIVTQPEEVTSLDDIINNREKVRSLPIFIFKNTEKRETIEKIHDIIKNNILGYTIILDKDDAGFAILQRETDNSYKKYNTKSLGNFIDAHYGYNFYINKETYKKINKDALDKKELVLF